MSSWVKIEKDYYVGDESIKVHLKDSELENITEMELKDVEYIAIDGNTRMVCFQYINGNSTFVEDVDEVFIESEGFNYVEALRRAGTLHSVEQFIEENVGIENLVDIHRYINKQDPKDLLGMYLSWQGIWGYTDTIFDTMTNLMEVE